MYWIIGKFIAVIFASIFIYGVGYISIKEKMPFGIAPEENDLDLIEIFSDDGDLPVPMAILLILLMLIVAVPIISLITILTWPIILVWFALMILVFKFKKKKE